MNAAAPVLRAEHISKRFGTTRALDDVSVAFRAGEVHALMGENGAGKSTLGKVIAGLHKADGGRIVMCGAGGERLLRNGSIDDAFRAGVRLVHQELAQCPNLSVAENLCLHDLPRGRLGFVDRAAMRLRATRLLEQLEPSIDVRRLLGDLSPGHRQIVQIASSLDDRDDRNGGSAGAKVIVLDEPTSSLSIAEVDRLLAIVRQLAASGITIIYVSHRMGEIFAACDRVTVLRDGLFVATSDVKSMDEPTLVEQMIGRRLIMPPKPTRGAETAAGDGLVVRDMNSPGKLKNVSINVAPGEILGVGGLVGAGRSELLDAIFGLDHRASGEVSIFGERLNRGSRLGARGGSWAREAIRAGVGYVPEDRKLQGLFFQMGADENIIMPMLPRLSRMLGIRSWRNERRYVESRLTEFQVKTSSPRATPGSLSGGNQQKLLLARWMGEQSRVLLLDEPTRGIDVGTKAEVYRLVREAAARGAAVVLVSSEMPELLALADRVVVLCEGRLTGELKGDAMTQAGILNLATAVARSEAS